jgi:hypothetical protein
MISKSLPSDVIQGWHPVFGKSKDSLTVMPAKAGIQPYL